MTTHRIFKFPLRITDEQVVAMPGNPGSVRILTVQNQSGIARDELVMWAVVDPDSGYKAAKRIRIIGTGNPMPVQDPGFYIATVQKDGLVWHVFDASTAL